MALDLASPTWRAVRTHAETRLADLARDLERPLDPVATATVRGQIAELRLLLATLDPPEPAPLAAPIQTFPSGTGGY
jgi:hypothetical protein